MSQQQATPAAPSTKPSGGNGQRQDRDRAPKIPIRWGVSEAKWMADRENELIELHLRGGETLRGYLVGLDQFVIGLEREGDSKMLLVAKHAIDYFEPVSK
jgi:sRNA-binding regulator protein Hfq